MNNLTPRELQVLELIAQGLTNLEIAGELYISVNTVKTYMQNIYIKLDLYCEQSPRVKARELYFKNVKNGLV